MIPRSAAWAILAIVPSFNSTARAEDGPIKGDLARLQGSWTSKVGPEKNIPVTLTFKGPVAELALTLPDGRDVRLRGEVRVDDAASPKKADWVKFADARGEAIADNLAIYKLDGDTWTVCAGGPGRERPAEIKAGEGVPPNLTVWTRVRPATGDDPVPPKRDDLAQFQGTWKTMAGPGGNVPVTLEISGDALTASWLRGDGGRDEMKGRFRFDARAEPRTVDFFGFRKADGGPMKDNLGIYAFDGPALRICVGGPGEPRPAGFKPDTGGFPFLLLFRKDKE